MPKTPTARPKSGDAPALFTWQPNRNFLRWDESVYGDDGEELSIWNGMKLAPNFQLNLMKARRGRMADFLYSPLLQLFVSRRALDIVADAHVPGVRAHRLNIRDREGRLLQEYFWINVSRVVSILDRERCDCEEWQPNGIRRIHRLAIRYDAVPKEDLFLFKEISMAVFSRRLVEAIHAAGLTGIRFVPLDESFRWP